MDVSDFYTFEVTDEADGNKQYVFRIGNDQMKEFMKKARLLVAQEDQAKLLELIEE